jgi:hypothetical protein
MFLRCKVRRKDGKQHRYWSVVENTRVAGGRVVQRHVLYLGEINDSQELAWRRSIEVLEDGAAQPRTLSLFPEDRCAGALADASTVHVKLSQLQLRRPRQWGACWLALTLWRELQLDQFWSTRLGMSRKGTRWDQVLFVLVAYRLLAPGSEWRLHRVLRRKQDEKTYCLTEKCSRDVKRCLTKHAPIASLASGGATAPLPVHKSMLTDVGPVELWATLLRRPSAAANPQGSSRRSHDC